MQQIERYGVIALVFFLITIVAVSFWGDSKSPGFWSRLTGRGKKDATADQITPPPASTDAVQTPVAPLDSDPARSLVQNAPQNDAKTGSPSATPIEPLVAGAPTPVVKPGAQPLVTPTPAVTPAATPAGEYTVQKGDSLALIARRTLGKESRWTEIAALNPGLTPKNLKVGAKLALPTDATATVVPPNTPASKKIVEPAAPKSKTERAPVADKSSEKRVASANSCKVQKGDTFKAIARRELGDGDRWKEIAELNPGVSSSKLSVGQTLHLPAAAARSSEHATMLVADAVPNDNKPRIR